MEEEVFIVYEGDGTQSELERLPGGNVQVYDGDGNAAELVVEEV